MTFFFSETPGSTPTRPGSGLEYELVKIILGLPAFQESSVTGSLQDRPMLPHIEDIHFLNDPNNLNNTNSLRRCI